MKKQFKKTNCTKRAFEKISCNEIIVAYFAYIFFLHTHLHKIIGYSVTNYNLTISRQV